MYIYGKSVGVLATFEGRKDMAIIMVKKLTCVVLAAVMLLGLFVAAPISVAAYDPDYDDSGDDYELETYTSGDFEYTLLSSSTIRIFNYKGSAKELTVPSKLDGKTVIRIGDSAFGQNSTLTSVVLPDTVERLGSSAFYQCTSLKSITLPKNITKIYSSTFDECTALESITIPNSVTEIEKYGFWKCSSLKNIKFSNKLKSIGYKAFEYCTSLKTINFPDSLESIGDGAFTYCSPSMKSVKIPRSVTELSINVNTIGYYTENRYIKQIENFTIYGYSGTVAQRYADYHRMKFVDLDAKDTGSKKANTLKVKAKTVAAKSAKKTVIKKTKAFVIKNAVGKVTFKMVSGNKKITVSKAGKITVKKGLKKGKTVKVKIKVKAAGNAKFKAGAKTVTVKIKIK